MIRDCLVEKIWEGTPNVLAIDLGKSTKDPKAITAFVEVLISPSSHFPLLIPSFKLQSGAPPSSPESQRSSAQL
jgi:hypothetical protein